MTVRLADFGCERNRTRESCVSHQLPLGESGARRPHRNVHCPLRWVSLPNRLAPGRSAPYFRSHPTQGGSGQGSRKSERRFRTHARPVPAPSPGAHPQALGLCPGRERVLARPSATHTHTPRPEATRAAAGSLPGAVVGPEVHAPELGPEARGPQLRRRGGARLHRPHFQMASQPRIRNEDTSDLGLGFLFHELEEGDDEKTVGTSVIEAGGEDEKKIWSEPKQGAGAEECHRCAGAAEPMIDENQKGGGGDLEPRHQQP
ncbi:uncharacterized protein LOC134739021 [Pongo pygmaeus]|uniref:uncharacterized protein LOC134739021 n=1 Tax=Pongo pygmaeus TaxID=9600 RepID=UPI00300C099B